MCVFVCVEGGKKGRQPKRQVPSSTTTVRVCCPAPSISFFVFVREISDESMLYKSTTFRSVGFPGESGQELGCVTSRSYCSCGILH
jgi:hypothetical protein